MLGNRQLCNSNIVMAILFIVDNVWSGRPVSLTRSACEKRSTKKLQMKYHMKYIRIKLCKTSTR